MKYLAILGIFFITACSKSFVKPVNNSVSPTGAVKESCSFGETEFNLTKRPPQQSFEYGKGKPGSSTGGGGTTSGGGSTPPSVIYLDFNGQYVTGTMWNTNGDINCAPANLAAAEINEIYQRVVADYAPFNITITTDEAVYNSANTMKRMRVVVTESWEWYGQAGGVSYLNSFTWGNNTPCFVFSSLLGYDPKKIGEACAHEAGHTLGLRHQSTYDASGVKTSEYNWGNGTGETGWAPIMGGAYYQNLSLWHNGPNSISSTTIQNDLSIISGVVGFKTDDYSNSTSGAATFSTTTSGVINSSSDADFFSVNLSTSKTISVIPDNVGASNSGADLDLVLKVYNSQGTLLSTVNDAGILNASTTLSPGSYYLSVSTAGNQYASSYGMLSKYSVTAN